MSLAGEGAVAIWHDIAPEGRYAFYDWHGREHMAERVAIPGFLAGRRFVATKASLEFFNLYEARDLAVLKGPDYRSRLNNPTPWTLDAVRHFRLVSRSICEVVATLGMAQGGLCATLRYDVPIGKEAAHRDSMRESFLPALVQAPGVAAAHLLQADAEASGEATAEQKARGVPNAAPRWVLILEGWSDEAAFEDLARSVLAPSILEEKGAIGPFSLDFYRHQISLSKAQLPADLR
jgi:hypothetical protein